MKKVLGVVFVLLLVTVAGGYYLANNSTPEVLSEDRVVYSSEVFSYAGNEAQFTVQYSEGADFAQVQLGGASYELERARSASGARYISSDSTVEFWEHQGGATLQINGESVVENATLMNASADTILTFTIEPELVECVGVGPMECMVVNGEYFYDSIDGFVFEPGFWYILEVARTERENVPADASAYQYSLVNVVSQTPASAGSPKPTSDASVSLIDTQWKWLETNTATGVVAPTDVDAFTFTLMDSNSFTVTTDCNNGGGQYTLLNKSLTFEQMFVTEMACTGDTQESEFFKMLDGVNEYELQTNGNLLLQSSVGEMRFTSQTASLQ